MPEYIEIDLTIVEPIELELDTEPIYYVGTAQAGPQGNQGNQGPQGNQGNVGTIGFLEGSRSSSTDEGTFGDVSLTDDYVYFCVQTGTAGNAIWKKALMFAT